MNRWLSVLVVLAIIFNIVVYWDQETLAIAWIVALTGWIPHMFKRKEQHGNS